MIRQATAQDYEQISSIKNKVGIDRKELEKSDYRNSIQRRGFLLFPEYELDDFNKDLSKTFLVHVEEHLITGYIRIDTEQELSIEGNAHWFNEDVKPQYYKQPHADLGAIAVSPDASHKGIGSQLLQEIEKEVRNISPYLFSFVVTSPITNMPSLLFHEKHGFERIAFFSTHENFGLKNYQSIMYGKKL